jgi:hypothetical protein
MWPRRPLIAQAPQPSIRKELAAPSNALSSSFSEVLSAVVGVMVAPSWAWRASRRAGNG